MSLAARGEIPASGELAVGWECRVAHDGQRGGGSDLADVAMGSVEVGRGRRWLLWKARRVPVNGRAEPISTRLETRRPSSLPPTYFDHDDAVPIKHRCPRSNFVFFFYFLKNLKCLLIIISI